MATATTLTHEQFQAKYGHLEKAYEFWYGKAIAKGTPTIIHGLLQGILAHLLRQAGFISASEVELRIHSEAHPRPDVIARKGKTSGAYPTEAWEVVVEILSEDDSYMLVQEKCRAYKAWGFAMVYLVDPSNRSVAEWKDGAISPCDELASIPVNQIWNALDDQYSK